MERFEAFTTIIANLSRYIRKIKTGEMAKWNLKSNHVSCIYYIYKNNSLTPKQLCDICEEDKANVSRSIEYLEENGYVKLNPTPNKRYKRTFSLTEKGEMVGRSISERIDEVLLRSGEGVSEEQRAIMYSSLIKIGESLQKIADEYVY